MAPLTATPTNYSNLVAGKLAAPITSSQTTGITVTMDTIQIGSRTAAPVSIPTGIMLLKFSRKTRTKTIVEYVGVDAGSSQSGSTATLGTATRDVPSDDGSSFTGGGSGASWPSGTTVEMVWCVQHAENTMFKNNDNTIATGKKIYLGDGGNYITGAAAGDITLASNTTAPKTLAQLAASSGSDEKVKITATDTNQQYLDDALLVTSPITKAVNNSGANETMTLALDTVPVANGGSGRASATAYGVICGGTTSTAAHQSIASVGTAGQIFKSNGAGALPTMQDPTFFGPSKPVVIAATASNTVSGGASDTDITTYQYTIPANDLVAGVMYEIEISGVTTGTNPITLSLSTGSNSIAIPTFTPSASGDFVFRGKLFGTTTAGASAEIRAYATIIAGSTTNAKTSADDAAINAATNGTLVLKVRATTGTATTVQALSGFITKHSTTSFT